MKKTVFAALFWFVPVGLAAQQTKLLDIKVPPEPAVSVAQAEVSTVAAAEIIPVIEPGPVKTAPRPVAVPAPKPSTATAPSTVSEAAKPVAAVPAAKPSAATAPVPVAKPVAAVPAAKPVAAVPAAKPVAAVPVAKPVAAVPAAKPSAATAPVPVAKPAALQPAGLRAGKTHTVTGGDTLWDLSGKYYSDPYKWGKIYNANLGTVEDPDRIYPAEELVIPGISEEVLPVARPAAVVEMETFREGQVSVAETVPVDAAPVAQAPLPAAREEKGPEFEQDGFSTEMPEHQTEWAGGVNIVPEDWREDGVITAKLKNDDAFLSNSLSVTGEKLRISMRGEGVVKAGDRLAVYMKGGEALDESGAGRGFKVQPAGLVEVFSVDGARVEARVIEAVTPILKGYLVKKR